SLVISAVKDKFDGFNAVKMADRDILDRRVMMEQHLISSDILEKPDSYALISTDEEKSIMLLEEDHIRIQVISGGFDLQNAYKKAEEIDDAISDKVEIAFSEKYGYLTACPTNTGTGLRASIMMHLPALTMTGNIDRIIRSATSLGLEVRGLYGEGSKATGSLYQLSNRVTLGVTEEETIQKIEKITEQIKKSEEEARDKIKNLPELSDRLWRSFGTLKYARKIESKEAKSLLSDYMLGRSMGIIDEEIKQNPLELMVLTEVGNVLKIAGNADLSADERDIKRAELLRSSV
ncbi:MAG: ATP--guanido phosphotransferase, partial [Clostridia bacterium]|nr:ATP--guanido phosphotransferase [Clostridia bacterium]